MPFANPKLNGRTKAQKEAQLKALEEAYERRREAQPAYTPADTGGLAADLHHKAKLEEYGVIGALFAHIYKLFIELVFNLHYFKKLFQFKNAQKEHRAYEEGAADNPDIYPIDPKTGRPDHTAAPLAADKITDLLVLLNGCQPKPTVGQGLWDAVLTCASAIAGPSILHQAQRLQLYGTAQTRNDASSENGIDGYELQAANAARMAASRSAK